MGGTDGAVDEPGVIGEDEDFQNPDDFEEEIDVGSVDMEGDDDMVPFPAPASATLRAVAEAARGRRREQRRGAEEDKKAAWCADFIAYPGNANGPGRTRKGSTRSSTWFTPDSFSACSFPTAPSDTVLSELTTAQAIAHIEGSLADTDDLAEKVVDFLQHKGVPPDDEAIGEFLFF
jgi:hypothetical protein